MSVRRWKIPKYRKNKAHPQCLRYACLANYQNKIVLLHVVRQRKFLTNFYNLCPRDFCKSILNIHTNVFVTNKKIHMVLYAIKNNQKEEKIKLKPTLHWTI